MRLRSLSLLVPTLTLLSACASEADPDSGASTDTGADTASSDTNAGDPDSGASSDTGADTALSDTNTADTSDSSDTGGDTATGDTNVAPNPAEGDLFCLVDEPSADMLWTYGSGKRCYAVARPVPWDPSYATNESLACTSLLVNSVSATGRWVDACPAEDIVGVCPSIQLASLPYWQGWRTKAFIYRSAITPDVEAIARNILPICETQDGGAVASDGSERRAVCTGSATATITFSDGTPTEETFNVPSCFFKRIGDRMEYLVRIYVDQGLATQRSLTLRVAQQGGAFDRVGSFGSPIGGYDSGGFWQTTSGVTQGLEVTTFDEAGGALNATYDLQLTDALNPSRTATIRGSLSIAFPVE